MEQDLSLEEIYSATYSKVVDEEASNHFAAHAKALASVRDSTIIDISRKILDLGINTEDEIISGVLRTLAEDISEGLPITAAQVKEAEAYALMAQDPEYLESVSRRRDRRRKIATELNGIINIILNERFPRAEPESNIKLATLISSTVEDNKEVVPADEMFYVVWNEVKFAYRDDSHHTPKLMREVVNEIIAVVYFL